MITRERMKFSLFADVNNNNFEKTKVKGSGSSQKLPVWNDDDSAHSQRRSVTGSPQASLN